MIRRAEKIVDVFDVASQIGLFGIGQATAVAGTRPIRGSLLGNTGLAQTFDHTGGYLGSDTPRHIAHDGSHRRLGMKLAQAM
jgi:hypothetical protein